MENEYNRTDEKHIAYHYCSVESFFNIIKNKTLWLSNTEYMNDKEELIWIDAVVEKAIKEIKQEKEYIKEIKKFEKEYTKLKHKKNYMFSFSKERDLLSQWRAYGDNSAGVAIGFHFGLAMDIVKIPPRDLAVSKMPRKEATSNNVKFGYTDVSYDSSNIKKQIIESLCNNKNYDMSALMIKELALFLKHHSFKEEKEKRLVYTPENNPQIKQNSSLDEAVKNISELKHRVSGKQIIPYYEFDFSSDYNSLLIPKIILGSKTQLKKDDLYNFLKCNGFDGTEIIESESTYQ